MHYKVSWHYKAILVGKQLPFGACGSSPGTRVEGGSTAGSAGGSLPGEAGGLVAGSAEGSLPAAAGDKVVGSAGGLLPGAASASGVGELQLPACAICSRQGSKLEGDEAGCL